MQLHEFAEKIRQMRLKTVGNPTAAGFVLSNGIWTLVMEVELYYDVLNISRHVCSIPLYYTDTDPEARSPEAQLIRAGIWQAQDCGWLIANIKGTAVLLAKVTPAEKTDIDTGWFTDSGQLILRRD